VNWGDRRKRGLCEYLTFVIGDQLWLPVKMDEKLSTQKIVWKKKRK